MSVRPAATGDNDALLFFGAVLLSLGLHGLLLVSGTGPFELHEPHSTVEIDLTRSARIGGSIVPKSAPGPALPGARPKEWVVSRKAPPVAPPPQKAETSETTRASSAQLSDGEGQAGSGGAGEGDGYLNLTQVSRYPKLINFSELQENLRRFYPEYERLRRNESSVTVELHVNAEGRVTSVDVIRSGGDAFDEAARKVGRLLRFRPAMMGRDNVAVKLRQTIEFKLED